MESIGAQTPLMDAAHYQAMKDALGGDFSSLVGDFFDDCPRFCSGLESLAAAGDADGFRELSHELKGTSSMLGFSGISRCAAEWEMMAKDGQVPASDCVGERLTLLVEGTGRQVAGLQ